MHELFGSLNSDLESLQMTSEPDSGVLFLEVQHFSWWVIVMFLLVAGVVLWQMNAQPPPLVIELLIMVPVLAVDLLLAYMRLDVEVSPGQINARLIPFVKRKIAIADLQRWEARKYSPLGEYGGWGIRGLGSNKALNARGNRGVQLVFRSGDKLLIGSQRADELASAISAAAKG